MNKNMKIYRLAIGFFLFGMVLVSNVIKAEIEGDVTSQAEMSGHSLDHLDEMPEEQALMKKELRKDLLKLVGLCAIILAPNCIMKLLEPVTDENPRLETIVAVGALVSSFVVAPLYGALVIAPDKVKKILEEELD